MWMKDHRWDPNKLAPELLQITPQRPGFGQWANSFDFTKYASMGSGFWVSADGWILTNEHVVTDARAVDLRLPDGKMLQANVIKTEEANNLALLKADRTTASWLAVSKGETDIPLGRTVFTVGYPDPIVQGVEPKFTDGRISADNVSYAIQGQVVRTFLDSVPAAKAAVSANPPKALGQGDERAVIDRVTQSAVLILRLR